MPLSFIQKIKNLFSFTRKKNLTPEKCRVLTLKLLEKLCIKAMKNRSTSYDAWQLLYGEVSQHYVTIKNRNVDPYFLTSTVAQIIDHMDSIARNSVDEKIQKEFSKLAITLGREFSPIARRLIDIEGKELNQPSLGQR